MEPKLFVATKTFVEHNGKILILREARAYQDGTNIGRFDVPGGRMKPGENVFAALMREVREETKLSIRIGKPFFVNEWYPEVNPVRNISHGVNGEKWHIVGIFFHCYADTDTVTLGEDHSEYQWIDPTKYKRAGLIENLFPVFEAFLAAR